MKQKQENVQASLLDRLLDYEPELSRDPSYIRQTTTSQVKASVIRDLENLLNTKRTVWTAPDALRAVHSSLFTYGLQDFTSRNPKSPSVRQQLRQDIERTILKFEPRLKNPTVRVEESKNERTLRFRITAMLIAEPVSEPIVFDTFFDVDRGEYVVSK